MKVGETDMYYVLQVAPGEEDKTERHIMVIIPDDLYKQSIHPTRHMSCCRDMYLLPQKMQKNCSWN